MTRHCARYVPGSGEPWKSSSAARERPDERAVRATWRPDGEYTSMPRPNGVTGSLNSSATRVGAAPRTEALDGLVDSREGGAGHPTEASTNKPTAAPTPRPGRPSSLGLR